MKIPQISVFLENQPGHLARAVRALADAGIDLATGCLADTATFGIFRTIVADASRASAVLAAAGFAVDRSEVLALAVDDRPGGLAAMLDAVARAGVDLDYFYAFARPRSPGQAILIVRFADPDRAVTALAATGVTCLGTRDLLAR